MTNSQLRQPGDIADSPCAVYKAHMAKMATRAHRDGAPGVLVAARAVAHQRW